MTLNKPPELSGTILRSLQCRLIFHVALATAMRPTELAKTETKQFQNCRIDGENVWVIIGLIGCTDSNCKNARCGVLQVNKVPKEIVIRNRYHFDGTINVFQDIDRYISV